MFSILKIQNTLISITLGLLFFIPIYVSADSVRLLEEPDDALASRIDLIQQAKDTLLMEYYSFSNDEVATLVYALTLEAADRGVEVRIVSDSLVHNLPDGVLALFAEHENIDVRLFQPIRKIYIPTHWNKHLHDKSMVIDNSQLIAGGRNIDNRFYNIGDNMLTRDRDIYVKSDSLGSGAVTDYANYFDDLWNNYQTGTTTLEIQKKYECPGLILGIPCRQMQKGIEKEKLEWKERIDSFYALMQEDRPEIFNTNYQWDSEHTVHDVEVSAVYDVIGDKTEDNGTSLALRTALLAASSSVYAQSPYIIPTDIMEDLWLDLKSRDIDITFLTNSIYTSPNILSVSATDHYKPFFLEEIGAEWWEFQDGESSIHAKSLVIDNNLSIIGSYNLDPRSAHTNMELLFFVKSEEFAETLTNAQNTLRENSVQLDMSGDVILIESSPEVGEVSFFNRMVVEILSFLAPLYAWST